jgi:hypothetical protein
MTESARWITPNELEDAVLIDVAIIVATAPYWLGKLAWLVAAGAWNDWRSRHA